MCRDFVAHGATEVCASFQTVHSPYFLRRQVTIVQRSATCVMSLAAAEKSFFDLPFSENTPIEELDFRDNSMPLAFRLQLMKSGGAQYLKMLDKELHEDLRTAGCNLTWEYSPGSGEVGLLGFLLERSGSGTSAIWFFLRWITFRMPCSARYWLWQADYRRQN